MSCPEPCFDPAPVPRAGSIRERLPAIPWYVKILAKIVLSRLPVAYDVWRRLSLFKHGAMDDPQYALAVFERHYERASLPVSGRAFVALELGPGDSVGSALIAHAFGAACCYLVDVAPFAVRDMRPYRELAAVLRGRGLPTPDVDQLPSIDEFLRACRAEYLTAGLASLRSIPAASVDFQWSQAVLEHVDRASFAETMRELRRILRPGGASSHRVDLEDHLAHSLNHLRFTRQRWESRLMARSGFYTNRLRCSEIIEICREAGFIIETAEVERWPRIPLDRSRLTPEFARLSDEELRIRGVDLTLRAPPVEELHAAGAS